MGLGKRTRLIGMRDRTLSMMVFHSPANVQVSQLDPCQFHPSLENPVRVGNLRIVETFGVRWRWSSKCTLEEEVGWQLSRLGLFHHQIITKHTCMLKLFQECRDAEMCSPCIYSQLAYMQYRRSFQCGLHKEVQRQWHLSRVLIP